MTAHGEKASGPPEGRGPLPSNRTPEDETRPARLEGFPTARRPRRNAFGEHSPPVLRPGTIDAGSRHRTVNPTVRPASATISRSAHIAAQGGASGLRLASGPAAPQGFQNFEPRIPASGLSSLSPRRLRPVFPASGGNQLPYAYSPVPGDAEPFPKFVDTLIATGEAHSDSELSPGTAPVSPFQGGTEASVSPTASSAVVTGKGVVALFKLSKGKLLTRRLDPRPREVTGAEPGSPAQSEIGEGNIRILKRSRTVFGGRPNVGDNAQVLTRHSPAGIPLSLPPRHEAHSEARAS